MKVHGDVAQRETREFRHPSSEILWEFCTQYRDIGIVYDLEVLQLWRW